MRMLISTRAFVAIFAAGERGASGAGGHLSSRVLIRVTCRLRLTRSYCPAFAGMTESVGVITLTTRQGGSEASASPWREARV
jgi:hypothetical protein